MKLVGLTGEPGAGKSTFASVFAEHDVPVFYADDVAKEVLLQADFQKLACERWGEGFFADANLTIYKKIAQKIFNSNDEYNFVTNYVHGETIKIIKNRLKNLPQNTSFALIEIPLLFETKSQDWLDEVIYITASLEKRTEQNVARNWTREEILRREAKFMDKNFKIANSDIVLENTGTKEEWKGTAEKIFKSLEEKFSC